MTAEYNTHKKSSINLGEWLSNFSAISWRKQVTVQRDDVRFVLDKHAYLDFYSASSITQQCSTCCTTRTHYPVS